MKARNERLKCLNMHWIIDIFDWALSSISMYLNPRSPSKSDMVLIGHNERPTGFKYAPIFTEFCCCCFLSPTITVWLGL